MADQAEILRVRADLNDKKLQTSTDRKTWEAISLDDLILLMKEEKSPKDIVHALIMGLHWFKADLGKRETTYYRIMPSEAA